MAFLSVIRRWAYRDHHQALHDAGIEPDWVIGTAIGAINASLIAGNRHEDRLSRLLEFWRQVETSPVLERIAALPGFGAMAANLMTVTNGISGFFKPNPLAFASADVQLGAEAAGYYSTAPLIGTLNRLVDFERINRGAMRLTVGAANVRTSEMRYFDSREMVLDARHVAASGALPPAFPAVRIDGELYWDGGILSNTPVEVIFDDKPRRDALVFAVHIWNPNGPEPETITQVINRQKDIQYASRTASHILRQQQIHGLRHVIAELAAQVPQAQRETAETRALASYGCLTRMHVVRLVAPAILGEDHTKDIDFRRSSITARMHAGYAQAQAVIARAPWTGDIDPLEGFVLHEAAG